MPNKITVLTLKMYFMTKALLYSIGLLIFSSCSGESLKPDDFNNLTADASVTDSFGNVYEVGYEQVSSNDQNPFVLKRDSDGSIVWKINHDESPVDGRANLVAIDDEGRVWVTFSVDGGSNESSFITQHKVEENAFSNIYMNSYGSGGGAKVSVLAQINEETGNIIKGTFITAKLNSGKTNSLSIEKLGFNANGILLETSSAAWPPGIGTSYQKYPNITDEDRIDNFFLINYKVAFNLSEIIEADIQ